MDSAADIKTNFAADFTAIDFETANRRSDSACQLAAVKVREGKIVDSAMWMIRPEPFYFAPINIGIHGIRPQDVQDMPTFGSHWPNIAETLGDDCLVAHNAGFDIGVLLACLTRHGKRVPDLHYTCTRSISRYVWPKRKRYGLKPLSEWLGIRFKHHDALEDSIACAKLLIAAGIDRKAESLEHLESKLRLSRGQAGSWGKKGPARIITRRKRAVREQPSDYQTQSSTLDLQRLLIRADFIRPLSGQSVVFTGRLKKISREDAQLLAARGGGNCQNTVTTKTNYLVVGSPDQQTHRAGRELSTKQEIAQKLKRDGHPIRIVDEIEFLELVAKVSDES